MIHEMMAYGMIEMHNTCWMKENPLYVMFQGSIYKTRWENRSRIENEDCGSKICWAEDWLKETADGKRPVLLKQVTFSF